MSWKVVRSERLGIPLATVVLWVVFWPGALHAAPDTCPRIHWLDAQGETGVFESSWLAGQPPRSPHFEPGRQTLIFIHGAQRPPYDSDPFVITPRPQPDVGDSDFNCDESARQLGACFDYTYFVEDLGFNVGFFYWKSVMKEERDWRGRTKLDGPGTEGRIWDDEQEPCAGSAPAAEVDVVGRFISEYRKVLQPPGLVHSSWRPPPIHLVAHSMGTQLAARFLEKAVADGLHLPMALFLLEPAWVTTAHADEAATLIEALAKPEMTTAIIVGKSTDRYPWAGPLREPLFRRAYRRISESVLDFWLDGDLSGPYPENCGGDPLDEGCVGQYEQRHRRIVRCWFEELAPRLAIGLPGLRFAWDRTPVYPYMLPMQCGPAQTMELVCDSVDDPWSFPLVGCRLQREQPWAERIEAARAEKVMFLRVEVGEKGGVDRDRSCFEACGFDNEDTVDTSERSCS